jgi:hypothetical protein
VVSSNGKIASIEIRSSSEIEIRSFFEEDARDVGNRSEPTGTSVHAVAVKSRQETGNRCKRNDALRRGKTGSASAEQSTQLLRFGFRLLAFSALLDGL